MTPTLSDVMTTTPHGVSRCLAATRKRHRPPSCSSSSVRRSTQPHRPVETARSRSCCHGSWASTARCMLRDWRRFVISLSRLARSTHRSLQNSVTSRRLASSGTASSHNVCLANTCRVGAESTRRSPTTGGQRRPRKRPHARAIGCTTWSHAIINRYRTPLAFPHGLTG